jgi:hypothetical protein
MQPTIPVEAPTAPTNRVITYNFFAFTEIDFRQCEGEQIKQQINNMFYRETGKRSLVTSAMQPELVRQPLASIRGTRESVVQ